MRISDWSSDVCSSDLLVSFGQARVKPAFMPAAPAPAARRALQAAGLKASDLAAITTHNPFIVNDLVFDKEMGVDATKRSEEHTSELQSLMSISYAVFCLKQNKTTIQKTSDQITT